MWQTFPCYRCRAPNYMGQRFCNNCGAPLMQICPYCGANLNAGTRFCNNCVAQQMTQMPQHAPVQPPGPIDQLQIWLQTAVKRISSLSTGTLLIILLCGIALAIGGFVYWQFGPRSEPGDITGPNISNVAASSVGNYSATITWYTDEPASSQVEYGTSTSYGLITPAQPQDDPTQGYTGVQSHTVYLSKLPSNKTHHFRVKSKDINGNEQVSGDYTFKTREVESFFSPADD